MEKVLIMEPICTVLLVENNPDDVRLVELAFEKGRVRHCLRAVNNGLQAMDYLAGRGRYADRESFAVPKLILLDLGMPGASGFELLEWLQGEPELRNVPVTVLSGSNYLRDVTRAYQLGAKSFLVKPSDLGKFASAIRETTDFWLEGGNSRVTPIFLQIPSFLALSVKSHS